MADKRQTETGNVSRLVPRNRGAGTNNHTCVIKEILARCGSRPDCRIWQNNTGLAQSLTHGGKVRFGLPGSSDLIGLFKGGFFLGIEVKTGSGKQTRQQQAFQQMLVGFGGFYLVAYSADEVETWLNSLHEKIAAVNGKPF